MLKPKNIVYGFCTYTKPNKTKYVISLYRSEELNIIAVFPTSQKRSGVSVPEHGANKRDGVITSYVFKANKTIGKKYMSDEDFSFPLDTAIPFDYCFIERNQENILKSFVDPKVVGVLSDEEYIEILYSFIHSPHTPEKHKIIFDKILQDYFSD